MNAARWRISGMGDSEKGWKRLSSVRTGLVGYCEASSLLKPKALAAWAKAEDDLAVPAFTKGFGVLEQVFRPAAAGLTGCLVECIVLVLVIDGTSREPDIPAVVRAHRRHMVLIAARAADSIGGAMACALFSCVVVIFVEKSFTSFCRKVHRRLAVAAQPRIMHAPRGASAGPLSHNPCSSRQPWTTPVICCEVWLSQAQARNFFLEARPDVTIALLPSSNTIPRGLLLPPLRAYATTHHPSNTHRLMTALRRPFLPQQSRWRPRPTCSCTR